MALKTDNWGFQYDDALPPDQWQNVKTSNGYTIQVNSKGTINLADPNTKTFNDKHVNDNRPPDLTGSGNALVAAYDWLRGTQTQAPQPGVGGPIAPGDVGRLKRDPGTGYYVDPVTGTSYTDANGTTPVANPNVAQQVATDAGTARDFLGRARSGDAEHAFTLSGQRQLDKQLAGTIAGTTPSVAQTMLGQSTDATNRRQLSAAAGVGGANAFAARRQALQNIAQTNGQADQAAAIVRAKEINDATNSRANLLGQVATGTDRRYATDVGAAGDFSSLALNGQEKNQGLDTDADKDKKNFNRKVGQGIVNGFGNFLGG